MKTLVSEASRLINDKKIKDSNIAQLLHYRITVAILLVCMSVITVMQYFGHPIHCYKQTYKISDSQMNTYCFWLSNYIVGDKYSFTEKNYNIYPGVGNGYNKDIINIAYYQWIVYIFGFQIISLYLGRYFFRLIDNYSLSKTIECLQREQPLYKNKKNKIKNIFKTKPNTFSNCYKQSKINFIILDRIVERLKPLKILKNKKYRSYCYIMSELINIICLYLQIFIYDRLLRGEFIYLGYNFFKNPQSDFLEITFPRVSKCHINMYGPSGTIQLLDALCVNSLNIFYEKIFIFLWFWFVFLSIISILSLIIHLINSLLFLNCKRYVRYRMRDLTNDSNVRKLTKFIRYSDWININHTRSNLKQNVFKFYIKLLSRDIDLSMGVKDA